MRLLIAWVMLPLLGASALFLTACVDEVALEEVALEEVVEEEPYPLTTAQIAEVKASASRNMQPEYAAITEAEFETICHNFEVANWDYGAALELEEVTASDRARFAHGEVLVWLWDVTGERGLKAAPGLLKGFCR